MKRAAGVIVLSALTACGGALSSESNDASSEGSLVLIDGAGEAGLDASIDAVFDASLDTDLDASLDVTLDVDSTADALPVDGSDSGVVYHDVGDGSNWSIFDMATVDASTNLYAGAAFDGRYVYLAGDPVARYDTQASFTAASSWSFFDPTALGGSPGGFWGAAFDGRYVYLVPTNNTGIVPRYDTAAEFTATASWSTFDTTTVPGTPCTGSSVACYNGAVFSGRYLYFVGTVMARYDTLATFTAASSWSLYDLTTTVQSPHFAGGVFDGRYAYFAPYWADNSPGMRYDSHGAFGSAASWTTFNLSSTSFILAGGAFDGRFVYMVPGESAPVSRYDTRASFGSWSTFNTAALKYNAAFFVGAAFDGRYVYLVPEQAPPYVARFDTQASFSATSSWSTFDTSTLNGNATRFQGGVFDGRYVYLYGDRFVVRFDAKTPPSMPALPGWNGSFF